MKNMKKISFVLLPLIGMIFLSSCMINLSQNSEINTQNQTNSSPLASPDTILGTYVNVSASSVKRAIESVNITYNNSINPIGSASFKAQIELSNNDIFNLTMVEIGISEVYTVLFTPDVMNATGDAEITILAVSDGDGSILNTPLVSDEVISIQNNLPTIGVSLNVTEIYRGDYLGVVLTPSDIENNVMDLDWTVSYHKSNGDLVLSLIEEEDREFSTDFLISTINDNYGAGSGYYINATCTDDDGDSQSVLKQFKILNNEPVIENIIFEIDGVETSSSSLSMFRGLQTLTVKLNASDIESNSTLKLTLTAKDPITNNNILFPVSNYTEIEPYNLVLGYFSQNITFGTTVSVGIVELGVILTDGESDIDQSYNIQIKNNLPEITGFQINGKVGSDLEFLNNDLLKFTFNVTDEEGGIEFVMVSLLYYEGETLTYFNYTVPYIDYTTNVQIRAYDIPNGDYIAYAYVIDDEGEMVQIVSPISFEITINESQDPIIWLLFVVGIILGASIGIGIMFWRSNKLKSELTQNIVVETSSDKKGKEKNGNKKNNNKKQFLDSKEEDLVNDKEIIKEKENGAKSNPSSNKSPSKSKKKLIRKL